MITLEAQTINNHYPIFIGDNILENIINDLTKSYEQLLIVTNDIIAPLYLKAVQKIIEKPSKQIIAIILTDGEQHKNQASFFKIIDTLVKHQFKRNDCLIALGGGVIGDLTGFAAACYMRGTNFIQIPTTLLAQVDASVGGKTAINHAQGKNLIGTFYQPKGVIIDTNTLQTLPKRELLAGFAEVIKYALINNQPNFDWLLNHSQQLLTQDKDALIHVITECCKNKITIVAQDEKEQGIRALLNLGHTFAHAIETLTNYQRFLHGEAVAIGLACASQLSYQLNLCNESVPQQCIQLLQQFQLPTTIPSDLNVDGLLQTMKHDKKNQSSEFIRLILLNDIGKAVIVDQVKPNKILTCLNTKKTN